MKTTIAALALLLLAACADSGDATSATTDAGALNNCSVEVLTRHAESWCVSGYCCGDTASDECVHGGCESCVAMRLADIQADCTVIPDIDGGI